MRVSLVLFSFLFLFLFLFFFFWKTHWSSFHGVLNLLKVVNEAMVDFACTVCLVS